MTRASGDETSSDAPVTVRLGSGGEVEKLRTTRIRDEIVMKKITRVICWDTFDSPFFVKVTGFKSCFIFARLFAAIYLLSFEVQF